MTGFSVWKDWVAEPPLCPIRLSWWNIYSQGLNAASKPSPPARERRSSPTRRPGSVGPTGRSATPGSRRSERRGSTASRYEATKDTFATDALRRGVPKHLLQTFLGHANARSTDRYARLAQEQLVAVLRGPDLSPACPQESETPKSVERNREVWRPQRESNPRRRLERAVS